MNWYKKAQLGNAGKLVYPLGVRPPAKKRDVISDIQQMIERGSRKMAEMAYMDQQHGTSYLAKYLKNLVIKSFYEGQGSQNATQAPFN